MRKELYSSGRPVDMIQRHQAPALSQHEQSHSLSNRLVPFTLRILNFGPLLILVLLVFAISTFTPSFTNPINIRNILSQIAVIVVVAIGQHLVILTRGIDLSVGSNLALATVIGGLVFRSYDSTF